MLSKDEIERLRTDNGGEVFHIKAGDAWEIVFKRPARKDCKVWRAHAQDPARKSEATEHLLRTCVVWPMVKDGKFDALLDRFPLIPENSALAGVIGRITGMTEGSEMSAEEKGSGPSA